MRLELQDIAIGIGDIELQGRLTVPHPAAGMVVFAHGSGSSRHSPRNRRVAALFHERNLATLLLDLLTVEEERSIEVEAALRFDVDVLGERLIRATDAAIAAGHTRGLPLGYFGGSTGAAAALIAAARRPAQIAAVVSRGGRPDLASGSLSAVRTPTLFVVGGLDAWVLKANRAAAARMSAPYRIEVIAGASHLFEEPGALDKVGRLSAGWFVDQLSLGRMSEAC